MKPSGIEWIGDIPDDWEVRRLKAISKLQTGNTPSTNNKNNYAETGFPWLKPDDLCGTIKESQAKVFLSPAGKLETRILPANSILLCCIGSIGKIGFVSTECASNQQITALIIKHGFWRYFLYVLRIAEEELMSLSVGNVVFILNSERLGSLKIPFPPLKTQQKIADYLDEKCGEIDATIAKQKESIEKLKAYKQSLISETVTKGLDKSAPLNPSGIEWIGDIPSHWEIKKLKFLVSLIDNKTKDGHSISLENIESGTGKLIETENTYDGEGISFKENDLLFGKLRPYLAKVYLSALKGRALGDFYVMRANKGTNPNFLKFVLLSDWFIKIVDSSTYGTKMPRASWDFTGGMRTPLPPISEQDCISSYLEIKCSEVDTFIIEKQNIIQKLDAYKKSLIFECVTGKKRI